MFSVQKKFNIYMLLPEVFIFICCKNAHLKKLSVQIQIGMKRFLSPRASKASWWVRKKQCSSIFSSTSSVCVRTSPLSPPSVWKLDGWNFAYRLLSLLPKHLSTIFLSCWASLYAKFQPSCFQTEGGERGDVRTHTRYINLLWW